MAANVDPRAVKFANEKVRPLADSMASLYQTCVAFLAYWNAQQLGNVIPFDNNLIVDGSTVNGTDTVGGDGRPTMSNAQAEQIFNFASMVVSLFERGTTDGSGTQNFVWRNNVYAVKVNGQSQF